jgi:hypothetical protein
VVVARMRDIARGRSVVTADGTYLGTVKDVQLGAFQVDAPPQADYWLPMRCVVAVDTGGLRLGFERERLGEFQLNGPEARLR